MCTGGNVVGESTKPHDTRVLWSTHVSCGLVALHLKYLQQRPRSALRSWMCCCPICAYSIAPSSTFQVGGWWPLPFIHLVSPACTAASVFRGWSSKHGPIVAVWSPTPSKTALPLSAAVLLTCILKSMRWSGWSAEITIKYHHTFHYRCIKDNQLTIHLLSQDDTLVNLACHCLSLWWTWSGSETDCAPPQVPNGTTSG